MGKPLDPAYWRKYRAAHPEYAARDRARCRARKREQRATGAKRDRSAEYAKRNAARNAARPVEPLAPLYPELQHGTAISFWEDELRMDLEQERWVARLEGRDEDAAVRAYRLREKGWQHHTCPLIENAA